MTKLKPKDQPQKRGHQSFVSNTHVQRFPRHHRSNHQASDMDARAMTEQIDRRRKYSPDMIPIVQACAHFGAVEDEIASYLSVSPRAFAYWKLEHPELLQALKLGTEAADDRVERSLYQLAIGWKGQAPNFSAACFWLKNRRKDRWRDVHQVEAALGHYVISERPLTEEEWSKDRATVIDNDASPTSPDQRLRP
jgi:hypothetical protein